MGLLPIGTTIVIALLRRKTRYFGAGRILGLLLLVSLLALRVWDPGLTETIRLKSFDIYQLMYPRVARQELAAVVDIDERSLQALGQWPWPRTVMAEMVSKIVEHGGTVIGFDVLFPEPDRSSPEVAAETFQGLDPATRETLRHLPGNDAVFAEAIRRSKVVLGQSGYRVAGGAPIAHPPIQTGIATIGPDPRLYLVDFPHLLRNLPLLDGAADGHGIFLHHTREGWRRPPRAGRCGCRRHDRTIPFARDASGPDRIECRPHQKRCQRRPECRCRCDRDPHRRQGSRLGALLAAQPGQVRVRHRSSAGAECPPAALPGRWC